MNIFTYCFQVPGTLAADHIFTFEPASDIQIVHASLVNTSANAGTLKIGSSADDDCYLAAENFGVSSDPVIVNTPAGFDGVTAAGQFPHIAKAVIVKVTITDHASHMANACVIVTATEG